MAEKPDAGDIVGQVAVPIAFEDTALSLFGKMERAAKALLDGLLPRIAAGEIPRRRNEIEKGSYFGGRKPEDGRIDWNRPAVEIYNLVRAVTRPYPGAFSSLGGEKLLVWWARPGGIPSAGALPPGCLKAIDPGSSRPAGGAAGESTAVRVAVGTGAGVLHLEEIEWKGSIAKGEDIALLLADETGGRFE